MKKYEYVNPRAFFRPDWMPGVGSLETGILVDDDCIWRNGHGKVMVVGFGIMDEKDFEDAFRECEDDISTIE